VKTKFNWKALIVLLPLFVFPVMLALNGTHETGTQELEGPKQDPLMEHLVDHNYIDFPGIEIELPVFAPVEIGGMKFDLSPTNRFVYFWIGVAVLLIFLCFYRRDKAVQTSLPGQMIETLVLFVRNEIVKPAIPGEEGDRLVPLMLTFFFFILIENMIGLIPYLTTSTNNLSVTAALAVITFFAWQITALRKQGLIGYLKTMMPLKKGDMPLPAVIGFNLFLFPLEFLQIFSKPFALAIRLFANMVAGHAVILSFILIGWGGPVVGWSLGASIPGVLAAACIYLLEILVAFLQAYVFTLLSAIFIGQSLEHSH